MSVNGCLDLLAHVVAASALQSAVVSITPRDASPKACTEIIGIADDFQKRLGVQLLDTAREALQLHDNADAWKRLSVRICARFSTDYRRTESPANARDALVKAYQTHFEELAKSLGLEPKELREQSLTPVDVTNKLNQVAYSILAKAYEKARHFWLMTKSPQHPVPKLCAHEKSSPGGQDPDFWAAALPETEADKTKKAINFYWLTPMHASARPLLEWFAKFRLTLIHEVSHVVAGKDFEEGFCKGKPLHGWLFYLVVCDAHYAATKRSGGLPSQYWMGKVTETLEGAPAIERVLADDKEGLKGWNAAKDVFHYLEVLGGQATVDGNNAACPRYCSPVGLDAYTAFYVLTRLNVVEPMGGTFPLACDASVPSEIETYLNLCYPLKAFLGGKQGVTAFSDKFAEQLQAIVRGGI